MYTCYGMLMELRIQFNSVLTMLMYFYFSLLKMKSYFSSFEIIWVGVFGEEMESGTMNSRNNCNNHQIRHLKRSVCIANIESLRCTHIHIHVNNWPLQLSSGLHPSFLTYLLAHYVLHKGCRFSDFRDFIWNLLKES